MTDGMFCAQCLSQYQEILSKTRLFGTRNCSKLGRSLYPDYTKCYHFVEMKYLPGHSGTLTMMVHNIQSALVRISCALQNKNRTLKIRGTADFLIWSEIIFF